ncbi:hypothetical protein MKK67_12325 [Methylobacterium sp. J-072]|uniref:hypothetical protein n=1 Tax=Methylobacterium sp. J-072 TaxID=2836651 RepID=UPI001FBA56A4|nr:hypothetical protein [Methylobacterium sp. J-072]MCJ2093269.1 hypothetical protein [Methylobacterium sp. J-072]
MSADALAVTGIAITVIIGVAGFFVAKKVRSNRQNQRVGFGGTGYQAGHDIKLDKKP